MQQTISSVLPIAITEYNWNPNAQHDPRATNRDFLGTWMSAAIAELIRDQVFAANQYVLTNNAQLAMIADRTHMLTAAGVVFQSTFEQAQAQMPTPPATTTLLATHTPTASKGSPTQLCFQTQEGANMPSRWLCVPLVNGSGQTVSSQSVGTLCFPLYPATGQPSSATISIVCVPVYEGNASATPISSPTIAPSPTSTAGTNGSSPTPIPTSSGTATPLPTPTSGASATPTPVATAVSMPTASVTPLLTPSSTP